MIHGEAQFRLKLAARLATPKIPPMPAARPLDLKTGRGALLALMLASLPIVPSHEFGLCTLPS